MKKSKITGPGNIQSTSGRQSRSFVLATIALAIIVVLVVSYGIIKLMERRAHSAAEKLVSEVVEHVDGKMRDVRTVTKDAAQVAAVRLDDPDALEKLVFDFVSNNDFVYGSTIAFEPDYFPDKGRCFAPYSWSTPDGEVHSRQLGTETDYYEEEWYAETKLSGEDFWSEPYFDEGGAKIMMCTFSVPLKDESGKLVAVMTSDVGLDELGDYISSISPYQDSYVVLRSRHGSALTNAEKDSTVGNGTIIIKDMTEIGWSVELIVPFSYLMQGDTSIYLVIGIILLITILFVLAINRILTGVQRRSSAEYLNVIDAISSGFSSIYLINLNTKDTFVIRTPEKYARLIDEYDLNKEDFTGRMAKYIECDCYAMDRAMMHLNCRMEMIRENLSSQDRYEVRFRKDTDGELRWNEMHVYSMERDKEGLPLRAVIAFTDVNESVQKEKKNQETLEQALTDAQSASKAKTEFLFNMSHDIRTPMNAIIGFTGMARKHIDDREKVLDCLEKTQQSGNLLLTLINSVLDVSRIESGHSKLEESAADVFLSFAAIKDTMTELAQVRDIKITFEIGEIRNRFVYCDLVRCNRVFVNIISNSIKYTNEGGNVRVKCEEIDSDREGYGMYRYTFEDDGIGMSEEFQKKVFDQFSREKSSTISGVQGFGLGLSVCKSFVELMGGSIECRSKLDEGSTFTVILPFRLQEGRAYIDPFTREKMESATDDAPAAVPIVFKGRKVLLVEDNELNREISEEILEDEDMIVETSENGLAAVNMMKEKGPDYYDFILMDIQMPVMDGYQATKAIRAMYPESHIPIIAVSANAFEEDMETSKAAGMDDHVAKPINVRHLLNLLAKYLDANK